MLKRFFILTPIGMGIGCWLFIRTIGQISLTWSRWGYSEWLINYEGGFVRRGLAGQLIHHIANGHDAFKAVNYLLFGIGATALILWTVLMVIQRGLPLWAAATSYLMPGSLVHALATNQFFFRKEISFSIPLLIAAIGLVLLTKRPMKSVAAFFMPFSAILGIVATLFHETFVLVGLPALCIMWWAGWKRFEIKTLYKNVCICLCAAPIVFAFSMSCVFSGGPKVANQVWASLSPADQNRITSDFPSMHWPYIAERPHKAISALGSNVAAEVLWVGISFLESTAGLWLLVFISLIFCLSVWLQICRGRDGAERSADQILWRIAVVMFVFELPVFFFSEDWGRWFAWYGTAVLIVWTSVLDFPELADSVYPKFINSWADVLSGLPRLSYKASIVGLIVWNSFFTIPEVGFSDRIKKNIFQSAVFLIIDKPRFIDFVHRAEKVESPVGSNQH